MFGAATPQKRILIVGAGIAGLAFARQLKKHSIPFLLVEKKMVLSADGAGLPLPQNAVEALKYIGLESSLLQKAHHIERIIYSKPNGEILSESTLMEFPLNKNKFVALHRNAFHEILKEDMENDIVLGVTVASMKKTQNGILVHFHANEKIQSEEFHLVVGADGVHSSIRKMVFPEQKCIDLGITIWRWTCQYDTTYLQPTYMFGAHNTFMAYPIGKNEVYCYAHVYDPKQTYSKNSDHRSALKSVFNTYGGIAATLIEQLPQNDFIILGRLQSVVPPLFVRDRVVLIGDAGHACSPMLQQGAASAIEDGIALFECLRNFPTEEALKHFEILRKERINWITTSSDGAMQRVIHLNSDELQKLYQNIRENGPLNVQGWKKLAENKVILHCKEYIKTQLLLTN